MKIEVVYQEGRSGIRKTSRKKSNKANLFISMLEDDPYFEMKVKKVREKFKIKNFPNKLHIDESKLNTSNELFNDVFDICDEYSISLTTWLFPFVSYIKYNKLIFPEFYGGIFLMTTGNVYDYITKGDPFWQFPDDDFVMILDKHMEKTEFLKEAEELYDKFLYKMPSYFFETETPDINIKILSIYKEIYDLKNRNKEILSLKRGKFVKIADILSDRHGTIYDDVDVRVMYDRYQKALLKLHRNKHNK